MHDINNYYTRCLAYRNHERDLFLDPVEFNEILQGVSTLMIASFRLSLRFFISNTLLHTHLKARLKQFIGCSVNKCNFQL